MMKGNPTPMATAVNPKSLVMLDAAGKVATLKLTTSTGLHVYDGSMLWVNPAQSVTAAAPPATQATPQPVSPNLHKPTKALPIVHPDTGDEVVIKKAEVPPAAAAAPAAPAPPPPPTFTTPLGPSAGSPPAASSAAATAPAPSAPHKEQNIIDLLAKATNKSPTAVLAAAQPLISNNLPPVGRGRGRDRERDRDYDARDQARNKGRPAGKGAAKTQAEGKGKGRASRTAPVPDVRKKVEAGRYTGDKYTKDAKYTASLDGRFWSLSVWPTGERDTEHKLTFGKHKLDVLENGIVKVVLFGGVNRYKVRLHLCTEDDELGSNDKDGWGLASCEPSAANLQLSEEAEQLGWKVVKVGDHSHICPPGVTPPEGEKPAVEEGKKEETKAEETPAETKSEEKGDVKTEEPKSQS